MRSIIVLCFCLGLVGCTQNVSQSTAKPSESAQSLMVRVAKQVQACWFKKPDPALRGFRMSSEVNSFAGQPRILIVPKNNPEGLPKLVAQAQKSAGRTQFSSFGPLLATKSGPRLKASLDRWAAGSTSC